MAKATKTTKKTAPPKIMLEVHPDLFYSMDNAIDYILKDIIYTNYVLQEELKQTKDRRERKYIKDDIEFFEQKIEWVQNMKDSLITQWRAVVENMVDQ